MKKSQLIGILLTVLFGPLGLFYSSVAAALGLTLGAIVLGALTGGAGAALIWLISILAGIATVSAHNKKIDLEERRHGEVLTAMRADQNKA